MGHKRKKSRVTGHQGKNPGPLVIKEKTRVIGHKSKNPGSWAIKEKNPGSLVMKGKIQDRES